MFFYQYYSIYMIFILTNLLRVRHLGPNLGKTHSFWHYPHPNYPKCLSDKKHYGLHRYLDKQPVINIIFCEKYSKPTIIFF